MKMCSTCTNYKDLCCFSKDKNRKDGFYPICKDCVKNSYNRNRIARLKQKKDYSLKFPEKKIIKTIFSRCNNKKFKQYKDYGGRGIECRITEEEILYLMERDGYWNLKYPSIDRIDNDGHYEVGNCQFIEFAENCGKDKRKQILQYDLEGNFIKEWKSITEASKKMNTHHSCISECLNGKQKTASGFIWRYKKCLKLK